MPARGRAIERLQCLDQQTAPERSGLEATAQATVLQLFHRISGPLTRISTLQRSKMFCKLHGQSPKSISIFLVLFSGSAPKIWSHHNACTLYVPTMFPPCLPFSTRHRPETKPFNNYRPVIHSLPP